MSFFKPNPKNRITETTVGSNVNFKPTKTRGGSFGDKVAGAIKKFFDSIQIVVVFLALLVLLYLFIAQFGVVDGPSMEPNFYTDEIYIYEKVTTTFGSLNRGDVIVFQAPGEHDFIKRVIGLPGDKIKIQDGTVFVNNVGLKEDYLSTANKYVRGGDKIQDGVEILIPQNQYVVLGDNRAVSLDSRRIGPIDKSTIKGKVSFVFWPLDKIKGAGHVTYPGL